MAGRFCFIFLLLPHLLDAQSAAMSGNTFFPGWYAYPEAMIVDNQYWVYPTFAAKYNEQVYFDAFSSKDLVTWTKHPRILGKASVKWARRAMWALGAQHSVINVPGTDEWYIVYHCRPLDQTDRNARVVCIDKMNFDELGRTLPVTTTRGG